MPLLYWALEDIQQTSIPGGFTIVTTSDVACHMWLRHTLMPPQRHAKPVIRRGLIIMYDARFCFVAFEDLEQIEPGDTFTHTFTWIGWTVCQTRYFYFWATNSGEPMHSTSPIFSKHYAFVPVPPPTIFYSDADPEVTSVDGSVERLIPFQTWAAIRDGPGTHAYPSAVHYNTWIRVSGAAPPANYYEMARFICLFDMSLALGWTVVDARYYIWGLSKFDTGAKDPWLVMVRSFPASNTNLIPQDYQALGTTQRSSVIPYAGFNIGGWSSFHLNAAGLTLINDALAGAGIVKLGVREYRFDLGNNNPFPGLRNRHIGFQWEDVDHPGGHKPYLEVVYA